MPPTRRNIEIKARLQDPDSVRREALSRSTRGAARERQVDRYFVTDPRGEERVKLRESDRHGLQLIRYRRLETAGVRPSDYSLEVLEDPTDPRVTALGPPRLTVTKDREVIWVENVRVHLDRVEGLGSFLELEAVVDEDHDEALCRRRVDALLEAFGIEPGDLVRASYSDLLEAQP